MSKLNVDEIEANGTNQNIKVITKGSSGLLEVQGANNDSILQLNCSDNSHGVKLKSPPSSAGQNYTIILPDNQIASNKLLKVKSITGSGSTAVGQLEYADPDAADLSSLNADNLTSGTVPSARFPSTGFAAKGAALKLISKQTVGSTSVSAVTFTGLEDDTMYKMVAKHIHMSTDDTLKMSWIDSDGNNQTGMTTERFYYYDSNNIDYASSSSSNSAHNLNYQSHETFVFVADISNIAANNWMTLWGFQPGEGVNKTEVYGAFGHNHSSKRIHGIKIFPATGTTTIDQGTQILLYKYIEA